MAALKAWPWAAAILSGVLLILCFPPWNQGWLCWIALTPLISAVFFSPGTGKFRSLKKAALGYVSGVTFFTGTFYWLSTTLAELYSNRGLLALSPLLALVLGLYFAFWSWFIGVILVPPTGGLPRFSRSFSNLGLAAAGASGWVIHEWVRERLFGGFGWNPLGVALHRDLPMIQIVEFTGVAGLSFLIAFTNLMAVIIVRRIIGELGPVFLKRIRWEFSFTMALIAVVFAYGIRQLLNPDKSASVSLRVTAIQPNIPQADKFDHAAEEKVLTQIGQLTELAKVQTGEQEGPQLILWPESAVPTGMFASESNFRFVIDQVQDTDAALLLGTVDYDLQKGEDYNTARLIAEHGQRQQSYRKIHLVPFGEYLPLRPVFEPFVGQLVPGDFTPGKEAAVLDLSDPAIKLGVLVCFEDTLGDLTRQFSKVGANVLINITNDGWFGQSPAAEQHLANATLRAVENRLPLIRCGNTGVTCAISATGHLDRWLAPFERGLAKRSVAVPTHPRVTFYARNGEWLAGLAAIVVLTTTVMTTIARRRNS